MRWGLIGASHIAETRMIDSIRSLGHDIVGVLSSSVDHVAAFAERTGIEHYTNSIDEFLSWDMDCVYVSSTNNLHSLHAIASINAGKHVLCEKPLATSVEDAKEMNLLADKKSVVLATNHHLRSSPSHQMAKSIIQSGKIGKVLSMQMNWTICFRGWHREWLYSDIDRGAGVFFNLTVHHADLARFLLGENLISVSADCNNLGFEKPGLPDESVCVFVSESGVLVSTHESFNVPFSESSLEIFGSEGTIFIRGAMSQDPDSELYLGSEYGVEAIDCGEPYDLYAKTLVSFENAILYGHSPSSTGIDGLHSSSAAIAAQLSSREGKRIMIEGLMV
jgi:1,5-anhydro-D-fructose reductase (1,5-anhydro-D-mannitol-forming)